MDFGVGIATSSDSWKLAQRAEELGFTHAWFFDTQMITGDCFVAMAAAALKTSRIRLGTGVLVPSNRIAAVTANAFATLNGMAPGRIDFGIGTGFSARRAMGLGAVKLAEMEEYIRVVYGLLNNETVETTIEGKRRKIRFLNPEIGLINTKDPIPLHISAYGPRSQALTAKLNAGWKTFVSDVPGAMAPVAPEVASEVAGYLEIARHYEPPDARYLTNHRGHFLFVKPEERKFVTAELIRRTTFTATEQTLKQRVEALREAGWSQLVIAITPGQEQALEDWARIKHAFD